MSARKTRTHSTLPTWVPLMGTRSRWLLAGACVISLALTWVSLLAFPALPLQNDSLLYDRLADYLAGVGGGMKLSLFYPPGYSVFLAITSWLWSESFGWMLMVVQHGLRLFPLATFAVLARMRPRSLLPGVAAVVFVLTPESYVLSHFVMSESLAIALFALATLAFLWLWRFPRPGPAIVAGLITGILTLTRPAGAAFLILGLVPWKGHVEGRTSSGSSPAISRLRALVGAGAWVRLRLIGPLLLSWAVILLPWMIHNAICQGTFSMVNSSGRHLFNRVIVEDGSVAPGDAGMARLNRMRGEAAGAKPTYWWNYFPYLIGSGLSEAEADGVLLKVSLRGLASHPFRYVWRTIDGGVSLLLWRQHPPPSASRWRVFESELPLLTSPAAAAAFWRPRIPDREGLLGILAALNPVFVERGETRVLRAWVKVWFRFLDAARPILLLLVAAGIAAGIITRCPTTILIAIVVLTGVLSHAAAEMAVPRYGLPLQPFVLYLACAGASWMFVLVRYGVRLKSRPHRWKLQRQLKLPSSRSKSR